MSPDLNDADLERQFRRRADSARLDSDWARVELLPAVRSGVDTSPVRVSSQPLAPLGGIAAVAAVLVLLVVALPRFVPGPQSTGDASPSPVGGPVVLSTGQFATRLAAGELVGDTVLVEGSIESGPPLPRPACLPSVESCYMGQLGGTQPPLIVSSAMVETTEDGDSHSTFEGDDFGWHFWQQPQPPVEGILALSVRSGRAVEYVGRVKAASKRLPFSADEASELDLESLTLDEIVLVDGWLTGLGGFMQCPAPQLGRFVGDLPHRDCGNSAWVTDHPERRPRDFADPAAGIQVQNHAYYDYAPEPTKFGEAVPEPRRATYALARRLEGWCASGSPPCWYWSVVARLTPVADVPSVTELPTPAAVPTEASATTAMGPIIECTEPVARIGAVVVDGAEVVESCATVEPIGDFGDRDYVVRNPSGDAMQLQIEWAGSPCHAAAGWTIMRSTTGFTLEIGRRPDGQFLGTEYQGRVLCIQPLVVHAIRLQLRDEIDEADVVFSAPSTASPLPAGPATPEPVTSRTIDCEGAQPGDVAGGMTLVDHAGLVDGCSVPDPIGGDPALIPTSDPRVLTYEWTIPCAADVSSTVLDFWSRHDATTGSSRPPYLLIATRSEPKPGSGCFDVIGRRVVQVVFNEPIAMADVEFVLVKPQGGGDIVEFDWGYFGLGLTSENAEYAAGEPIEIQAELLYDGIEPTLTLSGVTTLVNGFGIEQLDGPLVMGPGWEVPCLRHEIRSAEPLVFAYVKSAGWTQDDPNAQFYQEWMQDPQLRLPAGTWLVTAYSEFAVGSDCGGPQVTLEASIVVTVR